MNDEDELDLVNPEQEESLYCSFCSEKRQRPELITSVGIAICATCVTDCASILKERST